MLNYSKQIIYVLHELNSICEKNIVGYCTKDDFLF